jgi:hypothetical protein
MQLEVVTAAAYLAGDRYDSVDGWCAHVLAHGGRCRGPARTAPGTPKDTRTRAWLAVPLEDYVGKLVDRRLCTKARARDKTLSADERDQSAGLDGVLKLMTNTTYGVLASKHFAVGNTVIGNVITARLRTAIWMVAKALDLRQTVTDGGPYSPCRVPVFTGRRPGLDTLARMAAWRDGRGGKCGDRRRFTSLGGLDWPAIWDTLPPFGELDRLAKEQVEQFWRPYGLPFGFRLEHKNTARRAAFWSKADSALATPGKPRYSLRGKERNNEGDRQPHPTYRLLDNVLAGSDDFPADLTYTSHGILKVGKWRQAQASEHGYQDIKGLRPGDNLPEKVHVARYNNTHFPVKDEGDYRRRRNRKRVHRCKPVAWFEKFGPLGIDRVVRQMAKNRLR